MSLILLGKAPVRFCYRQGVMEASWTFRPDQEDIVSNLRKMLEFVSAQIEDRPVSTEPSSTADAGVGGHPPATPNGWELMDD